LSKKSINSVIEKQTVLMAEKHLIFSALCAESLLELELLDIEAPILQTA